MSTSPTLPTGPLEHPAMDYARLREEGIRLLERLAGAQWTDFNAHDPGVTILEQLCYALTDLGYRTAHSVPDLLAGGDGPDALPGPATILTCDPVTRADLRKLVLDVEGIGNAWIEAPDEPELAFYHHAGSGELRLQADPGEVDAPPVRLSGLHHVLLQTSDRLPSDAALVQVAAHVHAHRGLGEDFMLALLGTHEVWISARIEVGPIEDPAAVMADVIERIEAYLAPSVRFTTLTDARSRGRRIDELFEGPALAHGFALDELPQARHAVRTSDLIHAIMDVPAVRAVRSLALATSSTAPRERWVLNIPPGHAATLATGSELTLLRAGLPVRIDPAEVRARLDERRIAAGAAGRAADARGLQPAPGRDRRLARHRSIQHQLPAAYGVGALGLAAPASPRRQAQARQLEAYLLFFDQLLANAFAQLAHARDLLSPTAAPSRTYFAQPVEDPRLRLRELLRLDPVAHRAWLDAAVEATHGGSDSLTRRKRFLAHLLARFAEHIGDHAQIEGAVPSAGAELALIQDRQEFLRHYPRLSGARGSGPDLLDEAGESSGLEQRLRLKLGLREHTRFHLVEHVLLRPIPEDVRQLGEAGDPQVPLLAGVVEPDPWSLQISFVFAAREDGESDDAFEQLIAQSILAETPAHLRPQLHWFGAADGEDHWAAFESAWLDFRAAYRVYRAAKLRAALVPDELHLRVRDARDRVIDLLGFGRTYPLRDLPVPQVVTVPPGRPARIPIPMSQRGVVYQLRDRRTGEQITIADAPVEVEGTGGTIELPTPAIDHDVSYRILAVKREDRHSPELRREAWLHGAVHVEEGLDPYLVAQLRLPLLDPSIDAPRPTDARIADHGLAVEVEVLASQEGVTYELIDAADHGRVMSQQPVVGTAGTIVLRTVPVREDLDLRVRASKALGAPQSPEVRTALLDLVLPLRVRANPALAAQLLGGPVLTYGGSSTLRLTSTQSSVEYRVWRRRVRDSEFVLAGPAPGATLDVVADGRTVRVLRPTQPAVWGELEPLGEARAGTGGALDLPLGAFTEDALLYIQATRRHRKTAQSSERIASSVQLVPILVQLVRPDHRRALRTRVWIADDTTTGTLQLLGGQPGVHYALSIEGTKDPIGLPIEFHEIDKLGVEVGLAPAEAAPPPPTLETGPLPVGTLLALLARRTLTGLEAKLEATAPIDPVPAIYPDPSPIAPGDAARIVIKDSLAVDHYRLLRGDVVLDQAKGVDGDLELATGPLDETVDLQVAVERVELGALAVERRVTVTVDVVTKG